MGVNIHGGIDGFMANKFGRGININAVFPAHGDIVVTHGVGRDDGFIFRTDVRGTIVIFAGFKGDGKAT